MKYENPRVGNNARIFQNVLQYVQICNLKLRRNPNLVNCTQ